MGYACGFDIYPWLELTAENKDAYRKFLDEIIETHGHLYDNHARSKDGKVLKMPSESDPDSMKYCITFMVGECPQMPNNPNHCAYFLRFSSKVSGPSTASAEPYIKNVCKIAKKYFGSRVRFWHELFEQYGHYSWNEVYEAGRKLLELATSKEESDKNLLKPAKDEPGHQSDGNTSQPSNSKRIGVPSMTGKRSTSLSGLQFDACGNKYFIVSSVADKGLGLIATSTIPKGTRILSEKPIFNVPSNVDNVKDVEDQITKSLKSLDKDTQRAFLDLHNAHKGNPHFHNPFLGIVKTNSLPLGSDAIEGGIFLQASRINHSCRANAQNIWNANIGQLTIHALRDIAEGEEITISYLDKIKKYDDRQEKLKNDFKFDCKCDLCQMPPRQRKESDNRLMTIQFIDDIIGCGEDTTSNFKIALHLVRRLLQLLEEEGIWDEEEGIWDISIQKAYYDAFQIAIAHGDVARAKIFARRAHEAAIIIEGKDGTAAKEFKKLEERPTSHTAYGIFATKGVPLGKMDGLDLEKWLWKEDD